MRCPGCGSQNPDHVAWCGDCGRALRTPTDKVHSLTPQPSSSTPSPSTERLRPSLAPQHTEGGQGRVQEGPPEVDRFAPGTVILKHYTIQRQLGRGGMGAVHLAVDDVSGQRVAVKVLPSWLARDRDLRERFVLEARALAAPDHPGIVPLITFAHDGDDRFLVMKYVAGEVLEHRIRHRGVLEPDDATRVLRAMCDALASAHDKGVVHRDIKPTNVLIDDAGKVVIVDFGIARNNDGNKRLTETGMLMGTPQYMSPEQIAGRTVDGRADLYACGLVLFEMLAGRPPFDGEQTFDVLRAQVDAPVPDVRAMRREKAAHVDAASGPVADVPQRLVDLCAFLLEKKPEDRPATGHDVVAMLDGLKPVPSRSSSSSSPQTSSANLSLSSSWASLSPASPSSPKTAQTPAMAFSDEPDDDFAVVRPSPWRVPLLLLFAGGVSAGAYFGAEAFTAAAEAADAVDVAPADHRFELAALVSRATLAMEKNRNDDARVALDTALALAVGDETIEPLLLRTELMLRQGNVVEAEAMLRRLPTTLSAEQLARRDVLRARATTSPTPTTTKPEAKKPVEVAKPPPPGIEATKPVVVTKDEKKPDEKKPDEKKPDEKKPDEKKPDEKKPDEKKPDEKQPDEKKPDEKKPEPAPTKQEPTRPSQLDDAVFDDVTRASRAEVSFCYAEHELSSEDARTGAMKVSATVAPDGSVRRVVVLSSDFEGNADFTTCVIKAVGDWHFPPFSGGDDVVSHVFNFRPKPTP